MAEVVSRGPAKIYLVMGSEAHLLGTAAAVLLARGHEAPEGGHVLDQEQPADYGRELKKVQQAVTSYSHSLEMLCEPSEGCAAELRKLAQLLETEPAHRAIMWDVPELLPEPCQPHDPARGQHRRGRPHVRPQLLASTRHVQHKQRKARRKQQGRARATRRK